ncbi:52 kDa repressor of the inhibitor of the kinase-like [Paramuricea clavata]|uniref:52 kDa repressor of the inhibitor of the kinase-like n=1 Tax=Paramuricea clavata TaxID=317549 RepID=A0A6S7JYY9_PARCT|nr:52 kDa repressor of the inhibitor of the kinase-like [Paramuricea clavata]
MNSKSQPSDAESHFRQVEKFDFVVALVITQNILDHTLSLTVQLQQKKIDIAGSLKHINVLKDNLAKLRSSVDKYHNLYYDKALELAGSNFLHCKGVNWKTEFMKFMARIHAELDLWETSWNDNIADTLRNCNELAFPNIYVALKILAVIPVTTCECERSVSALWRIKTWLRTTMTNERLNGLALMHIDTLNVDEVMNTFARQNPTLNEESRH